MRRWYASSNVLVALVASAFVTFVLVVVLSADAHGAKTGDASKPPDTRIGEIPENIEPFGVAAERTLLETGRYGGHIARARTSCECMRLDVEEIQRVEAPRA